MPDGARLVLDVMAERGEAALLAEIDSWSDDVWERPILRPGLLPARREMRCFGWNYVTRGRSLVRCEAFPETLAMCAATWLAHAQVDIALLEQVIVTRYRPGAGIGWHTDAPVFGDTVATLSLGADWRMEFRRGAGGSPIRVALPRRSLLVLGGESRSRWQHRIPDVRATRVSLSFRKIKR
jgi:alkylated DNA repair dioxygenase AlkB